MRLVSVAARGLHGDPGEDPNSFVYLDFSNSGGSAPT